jgi:hypothetical protein
MSEMGIFRQLPPEWEASVIFDGGRKDWRAILKDWWNTPISSPYYYLIIGVISFSVAVVSTCTGKTYGRFAGWASRAKKPTEFGGQSQYITSAAFVSSDISCIG